MHWAAQHGILPASVWLRLPVTWRFCVPVSETRSFEYQSSRGDAIGRVLYWRGFNGDWEAGTIRIFSLLAREARVVLDIGANTGVYTLLACSVSPAVRVVAIEPVPQIFDRLASNVQFNRLTDRCELHQVAVSDEVGMAEFHVPIGDMPTSASLRPDGFRGYRGQLITVELSTVDSIVREFGTDVDLAKIDVEGFEDAVLRGMRQTLELSHPTIIIECLPDGPYSEVENILRAAGYLFYSLGAHDASPIASLSPRDGKTEHWNYLAVHSSRLGGVSRLCKLTN